MDKTAQAICEIAWFSLLDTLRSFTLQHWERFENNPKFFFTQLDRVLRENGDAKTCLEHKLDLVLKKL